MAYEPQLATLVKDPPEGDEWLHEVKFDGYRIGAILQGRTIRLLTRRGHDWTAEFPDIVRALNALGLRGAILDGEVCAVLPDGRTSFNAMQHFRAAPGTSIVYYVFDALKLDGKSITSLSLEDRKARLAKHLSADDGQVRYVEHVVGHAREMMRQACAHQMEGIISKLRTAPYEPGRSKAWLKIKCTKRQELVIGGFTDPEGPARVGIGALLVGFHDRDGRLVFAGKVGTGWSNKQAMELRRTLRTIERKTNPFEVNGPERRISRNAHWVDPRLVGEVAFTEWTPDGHIRHPSFQGLREDKPARVVIREQEVDVTASAKATAKATATTEPVIAGVRITHPDRVMFAEDGLNKLDLVRYYDMVSDSILPYLRGRPLTLKQCAPDADHCRYLRHSGERAPSQVRVVNIREQTKIGDYMVIDDKPGLIALAQRNIIEFHTWSATVDHLERPDRVIFDLDPGPEVPWSEMVKAARLVRSSLQQVGLESWVKTTGGKGLHVVAPIEPKDDWSTCLEFARSFAATIAEHDPEHYTTKFAKHGRERQILIDYLRNNRTNTAVAAYSVRARAGATVSVPIDWSELTPRLQPSRWTVKTMGSRVKGMKTDPWAEYFTTKQRLPRQARKR
jgi:bifunctional non-homologous end joining protein LigD